MPIHHAPSRKKLLSVHPDLQRLVHAVSDRMEILVICGHRGKNEQNAAFIAGNSKLAWPFSKHNKLPSEAVDCAPSPLDWNNISAFQEMVKVFKQEAERLQIEIRCGADWKMRDFPHIELANPMPADDTVA